MKIIKPITITLSLLLSSSVFAENQPKDGWDIISDRKAGNCLACHNIIGEPRVTLPGQIGPPLVAMKARYPEREALRQKIYDPMKTNPYSMMPRFGHHRIITEADIEKVVDYLYTK